jgi:LacI family transcriptional regulator
MKITLRQLALETGLSVATVSCALRGRIEVAAATRQLVEDAAARLGYVRDPLVAKAMGTIRRGVLGKRYQETLAFVCLQPPNHASSPYWLHGIYAGVEKRARQLGYGLETVLVEPTSAAQRVASRTLIARGQRGVVIAPLPGWGRAPFVLPWTKLVPVEIGHTLWSPNCDRVERELYEDMSKIFTEAIQRGYGRIGLAVPPEEEEKRRWAVLAHYLVFQQMNPHLPALRPMELGWPWTKKGFASWLAAETPDLVVTAHSNAQHWLHELGIAVPDTTGVIRCDCGENTTDTGLLPDYENMGASAVDLVARKLETGDLGLPAHPRSLRLSHRWQEGRTLRPKI